MNHGPVEILVLAFPGNQFSGAIIPELERIVANDTITIIDAVMVSTDDEGNATLLEIAELTGEENALVGVIDHIENLISDDDVASLTADLGPNNSAAILVFEHTWFKPLRDAIVDSGGLLLQNVRIPGPVVDEVFDAVAALD